MQISEDWFKIVCQSAIKHRELVEQLTMAGLEVDSVEPELAKFQRRCCR